MPHQHDVLDEMSSLEPTTGPMAGPKNGAAAKTPMAKPRWWASNMSAIVPLTTSVFCSRCHQRFPTQIITHPELVMELHPKVPARSRMTSRASIDLQPEAAALKRVNGM